AHPFDLIDDAAHARFERINGLKILRAADVRARDPDNRDDLPAAVGRGLGRHAVELLRELHLSAQLARHRERFDARAHTRRDDAVARAENRELPSIALGPHRAQGSRVLLRLVELREPRRETRGLLAPLALALLQEVLAVLEREVEPVA